MPSELISPNIHVSLIHFPLGLLIVGTLIEFFSLLWRRSSVRAAARWMILFGALSAIPATFSGIYALRAIAQVDMETSLSWADVKTTSPVLSRPQVWEMLRHHMLYQSIATGVAALVVMVWLGASDAVRKSLHLLLLFILLADIGLMIAGSHIGGQSVYVKGVAVEPAFPTTTESTSVAVESPRVTSTAPTVADWTSTPTRIEQMFPPLEMHATMAGIAIAIAVASIGLSFRKVTATHDIIDEPIVTTDPKSLRQLPRSPPTSVEMMRSFNPELEIETEPFAPAGRFWLLTFLVLLLTFLGGLFIIARGASLLDPMRSQPQQIPQLLWDQVEREPGEPITRKFAHAVVGSAIVILPLFLALLARFAPKQKVLLSFFTLLLAAAVTTQIWVGVLMLYDTESGKLMYFNPPAAVESS